MAKRRSSQTIGAVLRTTPQTIRYKDVVVLRVGDKSADIRTGDGAIHHNVPITGSVKQGATIRVQFVNEIPIGISGSDTLAVPNTGVTIIQGAAGSALPLTQHAINGAYHSGTLDDSQAPQFLKTDGSRPLTGNIAVNAGVTIDTVDLSDFKSLYDTHISTHLEWTQDTVGAMLTDSNSIDFTYDDSGGTFTATVRLRGTGAIDVNADGIGVKLAGNPGLSIDAFGIAIDLDTNPGLVLGAGGIKLLLPSPSGLTLDGTGLYIPDAIAGNGLAISSKVLAVGAGTGVTVNANDVAVNTSYAFTWGALHTYNAGLTVAAGQTITTPAITATANLTINPVGDVVFDPTGNDLLPNTNYDLNLGSISKKYLTLHAAELVVETLVAQSTLATIGGRVLIGPTSVLTSDLPLANTTIYLKHNSFSNGDIVYLEANGNVEFMKLTSGPSGVGPYSYTVERNKDGSGANDWYAGDAVFNTGNTGDGFIDQYSVASVKGGSEAGPTIVGNVRNSQTYNDWTPRWAIGNLNGLYGESGDIYGIALGDYNTDNYLKYNGTTFELHAQGGNVVISKTGIASKQPGTFLEQEWGGTVYGALKLQGTLGVPIVYLSRRTPGAEQITNTGFESDTTGWTTELGGGSIARSTTYAFNSTASLQVTLTVSSSLRVIESSGHATTAGHAFRLSGWLRASTLTNISISTQVRFYDVGASFLSGSSSSSLFTVGEWVYFETAATAPTSTATVKAAILFASTGASGVVAYIDNLSLTEDTDYVDIQLRYNAIQLNADVINIGLAGGTASISATTTIYALNIGDAVSAGAGAIKTSNYIRSDYNYNGSLDWTISNTDTGASVSTALKLVAGTISTEFRLYGSGSGSPRQNVYVTGAYLLIGANTGYGIAFYANATTKATLDSNGYFYLASGGRIGNSGSAPSLNLDIVGTGRIYNATNPYFDVQESGSGGSRRLRIQADTTNSVISLNSTYGATSVWPMTFQISGTEYARLDTTGYVGIADTSPTAQLDVGGTIRTNSSNTPSDGVGVEIYYESGSTPARGTIIAFDRPNATMKETRLLGKPALISAWNSAPADTDMWNTTNVGSIVFYLDESGNNLKVRVKYSGGTYKTATIALA